MCMFVRGTALMRDWSGCSEVRRHSHLASSWNAARMQVPSSPFPPTSVRNIQTMLSDIPSTDLPLCAHQRAAAPPKAAPPCRSVPPAEFPPDTLKSTCRCAAEHLKPWLCDTFPPLPPPSPETTYQQPRVRHSLTPSRKDNSYRIRQRQIH